MRDLLQLSEIELSEQSGRQRIRVLTAIGLSVISGLLALAGMMTRYSGAADAPLPGMDHLLGQLGWATTVTLTLLAAAWLLHGLVMQRLQWAVAISLAVHLMMCVSMHTMSLGLPLTPPVQADETSGARTLEQLSLPDYADADASESGELPAWKQPTEADAPESEIELERQKMELAEAQKPQPVEVERPDAAIEKLETPERQEQVKLAQDARAELDRTMREKELQTPQAVAQPQVKTAQTTNPELEAKVASVKQANAALQTQRQQADVASTDQTVTAAEIAARKAESKPQQTDSKTKPTPRSVAALQAAAAAPENVSVTTAQAQQMTAQERAIAVARQQAAGSAPSGSERALNNVPTASGGPSVSSVRPGRAIGSGDGSPSNAAPTSGGSASMSRSTNRTATAADSGAQTVAVAGASGVGAPRVSESTAASAATRGTSATVPLGSGGAGGATTVVGSSQSGATVRGTGGIARQSTGTGQAQPQLGATAGGGASVLTGTGNGTGVGLGAGTGTGRPSGAVGAQAGEVGVASARGSSAGQGGGILGNGPASTGVGRQTTGLPSGSIGSGKGTGNGPGDTLGSGNGPSGVASLGSGTGQPGAIRGTGGSGLAARGSTEPTARLDANAGFSGGAATGLSTARTGTAATLPTGAADAEQIGTLVFAGPQAQAGSVGGLGGPQMSSVPRRSAGLPGSGGPASTGVPATSGGGGSQPTRLAGGSGARPGLGDDRPKLASADQVAGLIKSSAPGIGGSAEAKMSASLSLRKTTARPEAARSLGGSAASEEAVERGLNWLVEHQHPDGHWSIHESACKGHQCSGHGSFHSDTAATGLALLAFLGAGYTHQSGEHQAAIARGLKWQLTHQKPDGDLFADESEFVWFYSHGMAAIAVCEAYGMTKDPTLREPAQRALNFIVASQHPQFGAWRYRPKFESDTSVAGWQLMALKSGEMSGLSVPKDAYVGVAKWLDAVESKSTPGQFSYHPSRPVSSAMTAEGLLMRQYLGAKRDDPQLIAGANHLRQRLPDLAERDSYFWYYGTQVMFHMQGEYWSDWNARLRDTLVTTQLKDGGPSGSWSPDRPTPDKWAAAGGRHYLTCLNLLMLEVYYRHLPLYIELGK